MKEEVLKLLESINLDYDENDAFAQNYKQIKENFMLRISEVKKASMISEFAIAKIQKCINEIAELDDYDKYEKINSLQRELTVLVF